MINTTVGLHQMEEVPKKSFMIRSLIQLDNEEERKAPVKPLHSSLKNIQLNLKMHDLWIQFSQLGTEMIVTKSGRRMFPTLQISITGMDPKRLYNVMVDFVPLERKRYRYSYHRSSWIVAGPSDPELPPRITNLKIASNPFAKGFRDADCEDNLWNRFPQVLQLPEKSATPTALSTVFPTMLMQSPFFAASSSVFLHASWPTGMLQEDRDFFMRSLLNQRQSADNFQNSTFLGTKPL
ncbi:T-box transcription factor TBX1-A [Trichinella pseudospiralis]|uniref:T-box transcription factor TBX1-A n=1 Tax=Trichinella pseudospiralis TaxID=6337 RepID=A0A0V0YAU6_TRIPS|nr:T-box transcription factor TBX1-A [Trichinella pseudospiralis]